MAEFVRFSGRTWLNTDRILRFDDDTVLLIDGGDKLTPILLETTCRDFQRYIETKRHEGVTYLGN